MSGQTKYKIVWSEVHKKNYKRLYNKLREQSPAWFKDKNEDSNILLIIDECHISNKSDNTLSEMMGYLDLNKEDYLIKKNIKILQISATPSNSLIDAKTWEKHAHFSPKLYNSFFV